MTKIATWSSAKGESVVQHYTLVFLATNSAQYYYILCTTRTAYCIRTRRYTAAGKVPQQLLAAPSGRQGPLNLQQELSED